MTIKEFKKFAYHELCSCQMQKDENSVLLDINVLLEHCLCKSKTWILLNQNAELSQDVFEWLKNALELRKTGLPIAYITSHKEFFGLDFFVTPDVLIPKPDTEILVENAIFAIKEKIKSNPNRILTVCDMCTGSGCIGISVLKTLSLDLTQNANLPLFVLADISQNALQVAKKNAENILSKKEQERIRFCHTNLFENIDLAFDAILTNPPYIPNNLVDELLKDGRSEPRLALDGDITLTGEKSSSCDGLELIRNLVPQAYEHLSYGGLFFMETGEYNAKKASLICKQTGFKNINIICDLENQLRVVTGKK